MPFKCTVCGGYSKNSQRFCSKSCSKKIKRMCKRIGCTETWYATEKMNKKYCRNCIPQSSSGPKYPYRLNRQCTICAERFTIKINDESDKFDKKVCQKCNTVLDSREWKCMRLIAEKGYHLRDLNRMDKPTIDFFYEECEFEYPKPIPKKKINRDFMWRILGLREEE
ncbi:MAG: hypothetical protein VW270_05685 [Candidatus Poseidoniales archaeon]